MSHRASLSSTPLRFGAFAFVVGWSFALVAPWRGLPAARAGAVPPAHANAAPGACSRLASELRERLEGIVEPVIEGTPGLAATGARQLHTWRIARADAFPEHRAALETAIDSVGARTSKGRWNAAAAEALELADATFAWCESPPSPQDDLARIDFAGMNALLASRGVDVKAPAPVDAALARTTEGLRRRGEAALAAQITDRARVALTTGPKRGRAASDLLELVDRAELAFRRPAGK